MRNFLIGILLAFPYGDTEAQTQLKYVAAPPDNPLKGLVPYASERQDPFPHSMEFNYLPLSDLMTSPQGFDWKPLEKLLNDIAGRRHQTVFRIWMEYPGHDNGIPAYLEKDGLKVTEWLNTNTDPFPRQQVRTPDYEDPRLRKALQNFIAALGQRYDGDPRIGYITAGLLGTWGEWHTYPRTELMPSKTVQTEVMDAFEAAFSSTPVLLRYPAGAESFHYAANHTRSLGYHDDSFAWATLDTGRKEDDWYFVHAMKAAGSLCLDKWKTQPIGGEIRPELWGQVFDANPTNPQAQDFAESVRQTHATWLMDTGMFQQKQSDLRTQNAIQQVQRMGYEFHVASANVSQKQGLLQISATIRNTGVAPFYFAWKTELAAMNADGTVAKTFPTEWSLKELLPGETRLWKADLRLTEIPLTATVMAFRVVNPMENGLPFRFANAAEDQFSGGWVRLGEISQ